MIRSNNHNKISGSSNPKQSNGPSMAAIRKFEQSQQQQIQQNQQQRNSFFRQQNNQQVESQVKPIFQRNINSSRHFSSNGDVNNSNSRFYRRVDETHYGVNRVNSVINGNYSNHRNYDNKYEQHRQQQQRNPPSQSYASDDVYTQIETLNKLREEYQTLRTMEVDEHHGYYQQQQKQHSHAHSRSKSTNKKPENQNNIVNPPSRPSRPHLQRPRPSSQQQVIYQKQYNQQQQQQYNISKGRNLKKHQHQQFSSSGGLDDSQQNEQRLPKKTINDVDDRIHEVVGGQDQLYGHVHTYVEYEELHGEYRKPPLTTHQYLAQMNHMQLALQQSAKRVEELLTESLELKARLKQMNSLVQANHRLQNELRLIKDAQAFLQKQIQMKNAEIKRMQKRIKGYDETINLLQKESELKDREMSALQRAILNFKGSQKQKGESVAKHMQEQFLRAKQEWQSQFRDKYQRRESSSQFSVKPAANGNKFQLPNKNLQETSENIKSALYKEANANLQLHVNELQTRFLESETNLHKVIFELEMQRKKNTQLREDFNDKINQIKGSLNMKESSQNQEVKKLLSKLQQSESEKYVEMNKEVQRVRRQMHTIKDKSSVQSTIYIKQLQRKVDQFEKVKLYSKKIQLIKQENREKQRFVADVINLKQSYEKVKSKNEDLQAKVKQLSKQRQQLQNKGNNTDRHSPDRHSTEKRNLQRQKQNLRKQVQEIRKESQSATTMVSQEKLISELSYIKNEYKMLEQAYRNLAKQHQFLKNSNSQIQAQYKQMQRILQQNQKQIKQQRQLNESLTKNLESNELKLIDLLRISQTSKSQQVRLRQLNQNVFKYEVKVKEKQYELSNLDLMNKKQKGFLQQQIDELNIKLGQKLAQYSRNIENMQQSASANLMSLQASREQIYSLKNELKAQQRLYQSINQENQLSAQKQIKMLESKLYEILSQKQQLLMRINEFSQMQYEYRQLKMLQRKNIKCTQSIQHLWRIKQVQYANIDTVVGLLKGQGKGLNDESIDNRYQDHGPTRNNNHLNSSNNHQPLFSTVRTRSSRSSRQKSLKPINKRNDNRLLKNAQSGVSFHSNNSANSKQKNNFFVQQQ